MIFSAIIIVLIIVFVVFDLYKSIEDNKTRVKLFNDKLKLLERIKNLENFKENIENEKK